MSLPDNEKYRPSPDGGVVPHSSDAGSEGEDLNEKALVRKLDWKLLPPLTLLYLLSFLDRSNIGNAKLDGLDLDLGITGNQYLLTLTVYFIGYVSVRCSGLDGGRWQK